MLPLSPRCAAALLSPARPTLLCCFCRKENQGGVGWGSAYSLDSSSVKCLPHVVGRMGGEGSGSERAAMGSGHGVGEGPISRLVSEAQQEGSCLDQGHRAALCLQPPSRAATCREGAVRYASRRGPVACHQPDGHHGSAAGTGQVRRDRRAVPQAAGLPDGSRENGPGEERDLVP